jgi:fructuronate reductase
VLGLLVWALKERHRQGIAPFTVLCCDNLPENGHLLRAGVLDMVRRTAPELLAWVEDQVAFPCTMVDRITPASTPRTLADAAACLGCEDRAAVEAEPFTMWVIEDRFPSGRPAWELAGALMVDRVEPFERMKLHMVNGAHSLLAYAGHVAGFIYVRDTMKDPGLAGLVRTYLAGAAMTLDPLPGLDLDRYADELVERFSNPSIAHETYQIAMDGTEKLPQRILLPAAETVRDGRDFRPFAFAVAAWMRYCLGYRDDGVTYELRDPRQSEIAAAVPAGQPDAAGVVATLMRLEGLFPPDLRGNAAWTRAVESYLEVILSRGMKAALAAFPRPAPE